MTTYVAIPNGDIDQDSPVTQPLFTALRDNPIAMFEGDPTAPKLADAALGSTVTAAGQTWVNARLTVAGVTAQIAGSSAGAVGTYVYACHVTVNNDMLAGATISGAALRYSGILDSAVGIYTAGSTLAGTWRVMGNVNVTVGQRASTLCLRIA